MAVVRRRHEQTERTAGQRHRMFCFFCEKEQRCLCFGVPGRPQAVPVDSTDLRLGQENGPTMRNGCIEQARMKRAVSRWSWKRGLCQQLFGSRTTTP